MNGNGLESMGWLSRSATPFGTMNSAEGCRSREGLRVAVAARMEPEVTRFPAIIIPVLSFNTRIAEASTAVKKCWVKFLYISWRACTVERDVHHVAVGEGVRDFR